LNDIDYSSKKTLLELINENQTGFLTFSVRDYSTKDNISYIAYIEKNSETGDYVLVAKDKSLVFSDVQYVIIVMLLTIFSAIIFGAILIQYYINKVIKPVNDLALATKKISDGDFDNVINVSSDDEIGLLSKTLESMRISILNQRSELVKNNQDLEDEVSKRTNELEEKTKELEGKSIKQKDVNSELKKFNTLTIGRELKMIELKERISELEKN